MAKINTLSAYVLITRPINLLFIVITQCAVYFGVIYKYFYQQTVAPSLTIDHFFLLVLATVFIGSGGYIINDILDTDIDHHNKPQKQYVGQNISLRNSWIYYWFNVLIGASIAFYLAVAIDQIYLFIIYPVAVIIMYLYSYSLKRKIIIGNIIVALFCGFVPAIVVFAERDTIFLHPSDTEQYGHLQIILIGFVIFSMLVNFIREIIKDIEDVEGDKLVGARTFAIVGGIEKSRTLSLFSMLLLFLLILLWTSSICLNGYLILCVISAFTLLIPSCYILLSIKRITNKEDCSKISRRLKILMAFGLLNLILTSIFTI